MEYKRSSELRMIARAIREDWPMSAEKRREAIEQLQDAVANPTTRENTRHAIASVLASVLQDATEPQ